MNEPTVRAVILAGGFGTRVRHLLPDLPKPMANVAGRPFLEWIVRYFQKSGISDFVLSTGYQAETVTRHFSQRSIPTSTIRCIPEESPLGTAGGFINCTVGQTAPDLWIVANGDSLVFTPPRALVMAMANPMVDAAVLGVSVPNPSRYGTLEIAPGNQLRGFLEKSQGNGLVNAGVYAFRHRLLASFPTTRPLSFETDVFPALLPTCCIQVVHSDAPFLDIGTEETFFAAEQFITANLHHLSPSASA